MTTIFIISAPSGSGKSTLVSRLLASDSSLRFSVSYTTRRPRGNEKPGESYIYITRQEFLDRIASHEFLEYAEVFGNYYGTHREVLEQAPALIVAAENDGHDLRFEPDKPDSVRASAFFLPQEYRRDSDVEGNFRE